MFDSQLSRQAGACFMKSSDWSYDGLLWKNPTEITLQIDLNFLWNRTQLGIVQIWRKTYFAERKIHLFARIIITFFQTIYLQHEISVKNKKEFVDQQVLTLIHNPIKRTMFVIFRWANGSDKNRNKTVTILDLQQHVYIIIFEQY